MEGYTARPDAIALAGSALLLVPRLIVAQMQGVAPADMRDGTQRVRCPDQATRVDSDPTLGHTWANTTVRLVGTKIALRI